MINGGQFSDLWQDILERYALIKALYIECEETDPELKTNLQPLNEFRAALDHIMKMMTAYYVDQDSQNTWQQYNKLCSHFDRAFFDICDFLSINYRNKIVELIEPYDSVVISTVFPDYYSKWKVEIEKISQNIANARLKKGNSSTEQKKNLEDYKNDVIKLRDIYKSILSAQGTIETVVRKNNKEKWKERILSGIVGALIGLLFGVVPQFFI